MLILIQRVNRYKRGDKVRDLLVKVKRWLFYKGITLKDLAVSSFSLLVLLAVVVIFGMSLFFPEELVK